MTGPFVSQTKTQDKVHNNHFDTRNPLSALFSSDQSLTEGIGKVFGVIIIMFPCYALDVSICSG